MIWGYGCGGDDADKARKFAIRYNKLTGEYPRAWHPCASCQKCIKRKKQLNKNSFQKLKQDCTSCEEEECGNFIAWEKIRQRLQKIGLPQTVSVGANPFLNDCKIAKKRAAKV